MSLFGFMTLEGATMIVLLMCFLDLIKYILCITFNGTTASTPETKYETIGSPPLTNFEDIICPAEPICPTKSICPAEPICPAESIYPIEPMGLEGTIYPTELKGTAVPICPAESIYPTEPIGPAGTIYPTEPIGPAGTICPSEPICPAESIYPTEPIGPAGTIYPTEPIGPAGTICPSEPIGPAGTIYPSEPICPAESIYPTEPIGPAGTIYPAEPIGPAGTICPSEPIYPPEPMCLLEPECPPDPNCPPEFKGPMETTLEITPLTQDGLPEPKSEGAKHPIEANCETIKDAPELNGEVKDITHPPQPKTEEHTTEGPSIVLTFAPEAYCASEAAWEITMLASEGLSKQESEGTKHPAETNWETIEDAPEPNSEVMNLTLLKQPKMEVTVDSIVPTCAPKPTCA